MHPILSRPSWFALYLAAWIPVAALFGIALHVLAQVPLGEAFADSAGLIAVLAFVCLSAFYPSRAQPIAGAGKMGFFLTHAVAAVASSAAWIVLGRGWVGLVEHVSGWQGAGERYAKLFPGLFLVGILFYALAEHQRAAQEIGQLDAHAARAGRIGRRQSADRIQAVEEKVRIDLGAQGAQLGLARLHQELERALLGSA